MARTWKCQRQSNGEKCGEENPRVKHLCGRCGKRRPATKQPEHRRVMKVPYEEWVEVFGERCGVCGAPPKPGKKLHRDHDHRTGNARGLLCFRCNRQLPTWTELGWMRSATEYLQRAAELSPQPFSQQGSVLYTTGEELSYVREHTPPKGR